MISGTSCKQQRQASYIGSSMFHAPLNIYFFNFINRAWKVRAHVARGSWSTRPRVAARTQLWHLTVGYTFTPANRHWRKSDFKLTIKVTGHFKTKSSTEFFFWSLRHVGERPDFLEREKKKMLQESSFCQPELRKAVMRHSPVVRQRICSDQANSSLATWWTNE